jgi:hypothetical protein
VTSLLQQGLIFDLTDALHRQVLEFQPQVVQVWFEPAAPATTNAQPQPIVTINGRASFDNQVIIWRTTDTPALIGRSMINGGRLLIRLHCGHLFDANERVYSSAHDCITRIATPHVPGGTFEGWVFVQRG